MLLTLTGSSCSGKSTLAFAVAARLDRVAVHDSDESGVPRDPSPHWRNHNTEAWIRRALDYQAQGIDLLLTGQAPLGEILAAPSAPLLDGLAVCLVDVSDEQRRRRLHERDPGRWSPNQIDAFLNWAAWHRAHALDPRHRPEAIVARGAPAMAWHRWSAWTAADPRWRTGIIDTTDRPDGESVNDLYRWITGERADLHAGRHPLRRGWAHPTDQAQP